jgi:hypothetical protein
LPTSCSQSVTQVVSVLATLQASSQESPQRPSRSHQHNKQFYQVIFSPSKKYLPVCNRRWRNEFSG